MDMSSPAAAALWLPRIAMAPRATWSIAQSVTSLDRHRNRPDRRGIRSA
jgi:hypothetical protein